MALRAAQSDPKRAEELIGMVYDQLRSIAQARMSHERVGHTLQATSLVNEACLKLLGDQGQRFEDRSHFFRAAATAMQRVLIDHARAKNAAKRGGDLPEQERRRLPLDVVDLATEADPTQILALDDALRTLEREDAEACEVVRLRFFTGLSVGETATILGISERTCARDWAFAKARLAELLSDA